MDCAILGGSGLIGQQFVRLLSDHPFFELTHIYASQRSSGKKMKEIWNLPFFDCPKQVQDIAIEDISTLSNDFELVFSALPSYVAGDIETKLRNKGVKIFSNASAHRMDADVPILIPELNSNHMDLVEYQQDNYNTDGYIVTNSNCSAAGASIFLGELAKLVSISHVIISTYQALSGAGSRGVSALDIAGNVIPRIKNEEPKIIEETKKILGNLEDGRINPHSMEIVANAARVDVVDGHLEAITSLFSEPVGNISEILESMKSITSPLDLSQFYIAPNSHLNFIEEQDRPQPKLDVFRSDKKETQGMVVQYGRVRANQKSLTSYVLVHNTIRGGAGGSVLNAEFARVRGML